MRTVARLRLGNVLVHGHDAGFRPEDEGEADDGLWHIAVAVALDPVIDEDGTERAATEDELAALAAAGVTLTAGLDLVVPTTGGVEPTAAEVAQAVADAVAAMGTAADAAKGKELVPARLR